MAWIFRRFRVADVVRGFVEQFGRQGGHEYNSPDNQPPQGYQGGGGYGQDNQGYGGGNQVGQGGYNQGGQGGYNQGGQGGYGQGGQGGYGQGGQQGYNQGAGSYSSGRPQCE